MHACSITLLLHYYLPNVFSTISSSYFSLGFSLGNSTMAIRVAAILPLGIIFFVSGIFINLLQAICFVLIWPLSKNTFRRINKVLGEMILLELVWVVDWWAGVKMLLYTDSQTFHLLGKEHALVILNHRSDIDWLVGYVLSQRLGCLGSTLGVMKKSLKFLPVLGWSLWFSEYLFLERRWAKDESTLKFGLSRLKDYPLPFWLALYVEGTRFTKKKLLAAQAYAASNGLPIPRNVLVPHTKGFVSAVRHMRSYVPAIYDVTLAIPENSPPPTMLRLIAGQPSVLHCHVKRYEMKELPENDADVAQWCRDLFVAKDAFLDKHRAENTFSPQELQETRRPIKPLLLVSGWACMLILGTVKLLHRSSVLSSWKGIGFSAFGFAFVAFLMMVMVRFSQSEHSTPMKVVSVKSQNGEKPSEITRDKQQ